jgi:hypothetical protein
VSAQIWPCPTCGDHLPGALAGCEKPACAAVEAAEEARWVRALDI